LFITFVLLILSQAAMQGAAGGQDEFAPAGFPMHPVVQELVGTGWWPRLQVLFLASVVAPIVEETMFRGVLYRHLREASAQGGAVVSVFFSGTFSALIFAVVHPQGLIAVPVLMGLAYGFAIAREWRGTLVPAMVAHGVSNGVIMTVATVLLGD